MRKRKKLVYEIVSAELQRLKEKLWVCRELTLMWIPNPQSDKHGEVKGTIIYIYDEDLESALHTLRHEFIDYYVTKEVIEPLIKYINMQKNLIEDLIYERKEKVAENTLTLLRYDK